VNPNRVALTLEDLVKIHLVQAEEGGDEVPEHRYRRVSYPNILQEFEGREGKAREVHLGLRGTGKRMEDRSYRNAARFLEEEFDSYVTEFAAEVQTEERRDYILQMRNQNEIYDMGDLGAASDVVNIRAYETASRVFTDIEKRRTQY